MTPRSSPSDGSSQAHIDFFRRGGVPIALLDSAKSYSIRDVVFPSNPQDVVKPIDALNLFMMRSLLVRIGPISIAPAL
jgi:hypothetical protein